MMKLQHITGNDNVQISTTCYHYNGDALLNNAFQLTASTGEPCKDYLACLCLSSFMISYYSVVKMLDNFYLPAFIMTALIFLLGELVLLSFLQNKKITDD